MSKELYKIQQRLKDSDLDFLDCFGPYYDRQYIADMFWRFEGQNDGLEYRVIKVEETVVELWKCSDCDGAADYVYYNPDGSKICNACYAELKGLVLTSQNEG